MKSPSPGSPGMEEDGVPTPDGMSGTEASNAEGSTAKRRRQQVKQACQYCRRRKIKCDEVRPVCKPCLKAKLACVYELPAGTTRLQAMSDSQQRLRDELHLHTSLIHSLRCVDQETSIRILQHLRAGTYDGTLLGRDSPQTTADGERIYPWDDTIDEMRERPRFNNQGMAMPYAAMSSGAPWPVDGVMRRAWAGGTPAMDYSNMDGADGADGVGSHPGSYAQQDSGMETPDGTYPATAHASQARYPQSFYQHGAAQYGAMEPPTSLTSPIKSEGMPAYGQHIPQYDPQIYPTGEASESTTPSVEDQYRQARR